MKLNVFSEIGPLKKVLLHRPGRELENLTPSILDKLLFDEIPYLEAARAEHDAFADHLRREGVEVVYLNDLVADMLKRAPRILEAFIGQFLDEAGIKSERVKRTLSDYFMDMSPSDMISKMIEGVRTKEVAMQTPLSLMDMLEGEYPFYIDPMPNVLFQRDPFTTIGNGVAVSRMHTPTRRRETIFCEYLFKYHPDFKNADIPKLFGRNDRYSLEGGDILVLDDETVAVGISQRTDPRAIEHLAENVFSALPSYRTVLAMNIEKTRAFMHLDTVLTQVDKDKFTVHPGILRTLTIFELEKTDGDLVVKRLDEPLAEVFSRHLKTDVELIACGGDDVIDSEREQWNDGANTLAVSPGKVVVYSRNHVTNALLESRGVQVIETPSSELSRGRGGPRCMSMPLYRESIIQGGKS